MTQLFDRLGLEVEDCARSSAFYATTLASLQIEFIRKAGGGVEAAGGRAIQTVAPLGIDPGASVPERDEHAIEAVGHAA